MVSGGDADLLLKSCVSFDKCTNHTINQQIDDAENIAISMFLHSLIEYGYNYLDISVSLWRFKKDESPETNDSNSE